MENEKKKGSRGSLLWLIPMLLAVLALCALFQFRQAAPGKPAPAEETPAQVEHREIYERMEQDGFGCEVEFGGKTAWLRGETAEKLFRLCRGAMEFGEALSTPAIPNWESSPPLRLAFRTTTVSGASEDADSSAYYGIFWVFRGFDDDFGCCSPGPYASINAWCRLPAGTYDALRAALTRDGALSASPGERVEGNQVYALFEKGGVYTVQLYDRSGAPVWVCGSGNRLPEVKQEAPGLWSVSVQAGTGIGTRWTVYYAPEEGRISRAWHGVLDRRGELLVYPVSGSGLRVCELFSDGVSGAILSPSQPLAPAAEPFVAAAFTEDGKSVTVTYLAGADYHEVTETIPLP